MWELPENRYLLAWLCFILPFSCNSFTAALNIFLSSSDISFHVISLSAVVEGCTCGNVQAKSSSHQRKTIIKEKQLLSPEGLISAKIMIKHIIHNVSFNLFPSYNPES